MGTAVAMARLLACVAMLTALLQCDAAVPMSGMPNTLNFTQALSAMPEWPKMVLFLPKGTPNTGVEFKWMHSLQTEMGSRLIMLSVVNDTEGDKQIMDVFNVTEPWQVPCAKVIKPGSVDLQLGKVEVYEPRDMRGNRNVKWSMDMLKDLAEKTALKIK